MMFCIWCQMHPWWFFCFLYQIHVQYAFLMSDSTLIFIYLIQIHPSFFRQVSDSTLIFIYFFRYTRYFFVKCQILPWYLSIVSDTPVIFSSSVKFYLDIYLFNSDTPVIFSSSVRFYLDIYLFLQIHPLFFRQVSDSTLIFIYCFRYTRYFFVKCQILP